MTEQIHFMEERAYAKINLSLRVLRKRPDAFHEIDTLIVPVSLFDVLRFQPAETLQFACDDPTVPGGEDNLVVRAAQLFFAAINRTPAIRITLQKNIPHGAGLGGGSSDAAATLRGLNRMFEVPTEKSVELAAQLGADVTFFLREQPARCTGRGEIVTTVPFPRHLRLLLLKPQFAVSTAWAYSAWASTRRIAERLYSEQRLGQLILANDLEPPVFQKFVFLAKLKSWLLEQEEVEAALLSGSGSTVFAVLHSDAHTQRISDRARAELDPAFWTCECDTLNNSE